MHKNCKNLLTFLQIFIFLFIGNIQCPKSSNGGKKVATEISVFGIKQSDIPQQYANIFIEKKSENIRWQVGAFLVDRFLSEFEQKYFSPIEASPSSASAVSLGRKGKMKGKGKAESATKKEIEKGKEIEEEDSATTKRKQQIAEFIIKLEEYKKARMEWEKEKMKKELGLGIERMCHIFRNLFLDDLFEEHILSKYKKKIAHVWLRKKDIEKCETEEKKMENIEWNIRVLICILHLEELKGLLVGEGVRKENKLYKGIQQMNVESNKKMSKEEEAEMEWMRWKKFGNMKELMRRMIAPDWVYEHFENVAPILMRIDIIEPTEMSRIYSKILFVSHPSKDIESIGQIIRLRKAAIFGKIWKLRKQKTGIKDRVMVLWREKKNGPNDNDLREMWLKILGIEDPGPSDPKGQAEFNLKVEELETEIREEGKKDLIDMFNQVEEFEKFLNKTPGSRARIAKLFKIDFWDEFIEGDGMANVLKIEPDEERIEEIFYENYLEIFNTKNEMLLKKKAAMRIFILIGVKYLDGKFGGKLWEEWATKYRPRFFFFMDQLVDSDQNFCELNGIFYRNLLYSLIRKLAEEGRSGEGDANLNSELELERLKGEISGSRGLMDFEKQMEIAKKANSKIIKKLRAKYPKLEEAIREKKFVNDEEIFDFLNNGAKKKAFSSASPALHAYFSWNPNFLEPYKQFLIGNDDDEKAEERKKEINLDATLWHYKNVFDNLIEGANDVLNSIGEFPNFWEYLTTFKAENYATKNQKLCKLQVFIQDSLATNPEITKLPEWEEDFLELLKVNNFVIENCDTEENAINYGIRIVEDLENKCELYFDYLNWLLTHSEDFQQFLLEIPGNSYKDKIIDILTVEGEEKNNIYELLAELEKMHPKWLRIDQIHEKMQMELYKIILQVKEYKLESMIAERRVAVPLLIDEIKMMKKTSPNLGLAAENPAEFEKIQRKIDEVLENAYEQRGPNFDSLENMCFLMQFIALFKFESEFMEGELSYVLKQIEDEEIIQEYNRELCKNEETQNETWLLEREMLLKIHTAFLLNSKWRKEIMELVEKFGGMNRMWLLTEYAISSLFIPKKDFSMDSILRQHFMEAIFGQDAEDRQANKMAVNYFSWARHIDKKVENLLKRKDMNEYKGTKPKILAEIWRRKSVRLNLINEYDALGNTELRYLVEKEIHMARLHSDILDVINEAEKNEFTRKQFEKIFEEFFIEWKYAKNDKEWEEDENKKFQEYIRMVRELNREEFLMQLNTKFTDFHENIARQIFYQQITEKLKYASEKEKNRLKQLVGLDIEEIGKILEKVDSKDTAQKKGTVLKNELVESGASSSAAAGASSGSKFLDESLKTIEMSELDKESKTQIAEENKKDKNSTENKNFSKATNEDDKKSQKADQKEIGEQSLKGNIKEAKIKEEQNRLAKAKKNQKNIKHRENKRERKFRKKAQQQQQWRNKIKEEEEANKITEKEKLSKINKHLIIEELIKMLKNKGYGEFPNSDMNEGSEKRRMASRKRYLNQSEFTIIEIMEMLANWNKQSRMLISGSLQLKLNSEDSDIDLIVLMPYDRNENWAKEFENIFTGNSKSKCKIVEKRCENGDENSLYCHLCKADKVIFLQKIPSRIPLIKMRLKRNIPIDINMALVPKELLANKHFPTIHQQQQIYKNYGKLKDKMEEIIKRQPSLGEIDELIRNIIVKIGEEVIGRKIKEKLEKGKNNKNVELDGENLAKIEESMKPEIVGTKEIWKAMGMALVNDENRDKREGMIMALSGYRGNRQIVELLGNGEKYRNFQIASLALKLWAKKHFIYSGLFGFFNGATLAVMVCKSAMEMEESGENASALALLEQFFGKYHREGDGMLGEIHLEFEKNDQNIRQLLDWTPGRETAARRGNAPGWQVITAGFPTQNAAFNIIPPTRRIINAELGDAMGKVAEIRELVEMAEEPPANLIQQKFANLLEKPKFVEKYNNFVAIVCKYPAQSVHGPEFCNFLELKLRLKLPEIDEAQIDYSHIMPERIFDKKRCLERFRSPSIQKDEDLCTIWVAGIKPREQANARNFEIEAALDWVKDESQRGQKIISKLKDEYLAHLGEEPNEQLKRGFGAMFRYIFKADLLKWMPKKYL